ncbi:MAG TPA: SCO family protein [Methylocella sp.]|nr:SCO family protein [Methylocella sp.]
MRKSTRPVGASGIALAVWAGLICDPAIAAADAISSLPSPGTYALDHIQKVPFGIVLEGNHFPRLLSHYTLGKITLFSFFYTTCADPTGCPLTWSVFEDVRERVLADPTLHGQVRLVFFSLDPAHDTPAMLSILAANYKRDAANVPWYFLTTYSYRFLTPLLREMGEDISVDRDASTSGRPAFYHLLKAFLIDRQGWVREIYSNQSLEPAAIIGDIKTLLLGSERERKP